MIYTKKAEYEWIVGMIDGDGFLDLERTKNRDRFYYRPVLAITQKDAKLLYKIKKILYVGRVSKRNDGYYHYRVRSRKLFEQFLIPIFEKYPFRSNKQLQYRLLLRSLKVLTNYNGFASEQTAQNKQKYLLKQSHLNRYIQWIRQARRRKIRNLKPISFAWFVGFFDSEGCISISNKKGTFQYKFVIKISQSEVHYLLLQGIKNLLKIGHISTERLFENELGMGKRQNIYYWGITHRRDIRKLITLFNKYPLKSDKNIQWLHFLKLLRLRPTTKKSQQRFHRLLLSLTKQKQIEDRVPTKLKNLEK
uniref:Homing endonuclease LAGLIDADG domain-containing protein n=1 Tax=Rhipiliopsis peltata TaxID=2320810 RepID=A0A386B1A3_9CHLO|nr:hypothetical protein [Rhipiliopsis peltata]AYC65467.1 hypothetical protein [Rhipiliopsis peltata]